MKKENMIVDFDSTMVTSCKTIVELYQKKNKDYSKQYKDEDLEWNFEPYITEKKDLEWALHMFSEQEFYDNLEPIEGAVEVLERLSKKYNIIVVTKKHPDAVSMNAQFLRNTFPFIKRTVYLDQEDFDKSLIVGKIQIDDKVECLLGGDRNLRLLIGNYKYQRPILFHEDGTVVTENILRIKDWFQIEKLLDSLHKDEIVESPTNDDYKILAEKSNKTMRERVLHNQINMTLFNN